MDKKVTVIIPSFNAEDCISKALSSLLNQTIGFENIEVLIVDDCSTDNTPNILKEFSEKYSNIKCIFFEKNHGAPGQGRNTGIENATSDYIMFLDNDDTYDSNYCEDMYNAIVKYNSDIGMSRLKYVDVNGNIKTRTDELSKINEDFILLDPKKEDTVFNDSFVWNKIFKKEFLLNNNIEFPLTYFEDVYFNIQSYLASENLVFLNNCHGYNHLLLEWGEKPFTKDILFNNFDSFVKLCELFNENQRIYLEKFFYTHIIDFLIHFVNSDMSHECKIKFLNLVYDLEVKYGFNGKLNQYWAEIIYKNIRKKNFERTIFLSKIIKFILNFTFARKVYLKLYKGE